MVILVFTVWTYLNEAKVADECLTQGGSYDYENKICDFENDHSFTPFSKRHPILLSLSSIGFITTMILTTKKKTIQPAG